MRGQSPASAGVPDHESGRQPAVFRYLAKKGVWRQLQENPNIEILTADNRISVRCAGMVQFDVPDAVQREIYEANPVLPRLYAHYTDLVYFVLPIAELDYFDLGTTPPVFKHFDLITGETGNGFVGERFAK